MSESKCELCNVTYKSLSRHLRSKKHLARTEPVEPDPDPEYTETERELIADMKRATARLDFGLQTSEECPLCSKNNSWDENRLLIEIVNNKLDQVIRNQGILLESIVKRQTPLNYV